MAQANQPLEEKGLMGVPAFTNAFTSWITQNRSFPYVIRKYESNGVLYETATGSGVQRVAAVGRWGYSKNPIKAISGVRGWRDPSGYARLSTNYLISPCLYSATDLTGLKRRWVYQGYYNLDQNMMQNLFTFPIGDRGHSTLTDEKNRARVECLNRLKKQRIDLGTFLGEAKTSATMLATSMIRLGTILRELRRGNLGVARRAGLGLWRSSGTAANLYLEYQYGWKPLLSDLYAAYLISRDGLKNPLFMKASRRIKSEYGSTADTLYFTERQQKVTGHNECKIIARVSDATLQRAAQINVINPAQVAWELIPLSFVIDWGLPISDYLSALSATAGLTFVGGYESQLLEAEISAFRKLPASSWATVYEGYMCKVEVKHFDFERSKLNDFPIPLPYAKSPFSNNHLLSATALWRSLSGRRSR